MTRVIQLSVLVGAIFLSLSCYAAQSTADVAASAQLKKEAYEKIKQATAEAEREKEYIIGPGDFLQIHVYGEGDMSATDMSEGMLDLGASKDLKGIMVRIDGRASLKHLGDVEVTGLTLTELADYLKVLYATVFDDPLVTVVLEQSNSKRYTVMGKVVNPGLYNINFPLNIVQAIAQSGGFTEWANSKITVVRKNVREEKKLFNGNKLLFDYDKFLDGKELEKNIVLKAEDILIVH